MILAMRLWVAAMVAGICWTRWASGLLTVAALGVSLMAGNRALGHPFGWIAMVAIGITPWLLAAQRAHQEQRAKRLQASEAMKLNRLQEHARQLLQGQAANQQLETRITQITELYHVTKETARALHVEELFSRSLDLIPRLLDVKGLRLVDASAGLESPLVWRARCAEAGRLVADQTNHPTPFERDLLAKTVQSPEAAFATRQRLTVAWPADLARVAWAPLWSEQQPSGTLIADELPPEQVGTLSIIANQLSLQLSRIRFYQAVESMAVTDTLTGLFVRRYFMEFAAEELERSKRHDLSCTLLMADLDEFKMKNDTYGHLTGDVVLREVAQLMRKNLREVDLIARYGGEEFILMLVETGPDQAMAIAERLRQLVEVQPIRAYDEALTQTVSIGMASFPDDGEGLQPLIDRADQALYAAKRAGRNRIVRWSPSVA